MRALKNLDKLRERENLDKLIVEKNISPLMNDTKWVKLIKVFVENCNQILECQVKLLWEDDYCDRKLVFDENTSYNFDFYDKSMEAMITGSPKGWYDYKEIEYLEFPKKINFKMKNGTVQIKEQNLDLIKKLILEIGNFEIYLVSDYLRIYAYYR